MPKDTWIDQHLEEFVRPNLRKIPNVKGYTPWKPDQLLCLQAIWWKIKQRVREVQRPLLLPGRDVFLIEVLARMEGFPTLYRKEMSSPVAGASNVLLKSEWPFNKFYCVDTGFGGSVPRALGVECWNLIGGVQSFFGNDYTNPLYNIAGKLEGVPKYWSRAEVEYCPNTGVPQKIRQRIMETGMLESAVRNTMIVAMHHRDHPMSEDLANRILGDYTCLNELTGSSYSKTNSTVPLAMPSSPPSPVTPSQRPRASRRVRRSTKAPTISFSSTTTCTVTSRTVETQTPDTNLPSGSWPKLNLETVSPK